MDIRRFEASPNGRLVKIRGTDGRTGRPYEHQAFVAEPLGDEPELSGATWRTVTAATRALARLDQAARHQVPRPELLRGPSLRREAQSTSALEGAFAPLDQVLAADQEDDEHLSAPMREVLNYIDAAEFAFDELAHTGKITVAMLEGAHERLVRGTNSETRDAGRLRTVPVAIGSSTGTMEESRFVPMPPGHDLAIAVRQLTDWINDFSADHDPLVSAALAHYQFETLHPFHDGNGRLGRLLIVLHLMSANLLAEPLLSVSPWFETRRVRYQDGLADVSAEGTWDDWVRFFAEGVRTSAEDTLERVNLLLEIQASYLQTVADAGIKGLARDIAESLIGNPVVTVPRLERRFGKRAASTNEAVKKLVTLGILSEPVGTYNRRFYARRVLIALTHATV